MQRGWQEHEQRELTGLPPQVVAAGLGDPTRWAAAAESAGGAHRRQGAAADAAAGVHIWWAAAAGVHICWAAAARQIC